MEQDYNSFNNIQNNNNLQNENNTISSSSASISSDMSERKNQTDSRNDNIYRDYMNRSGGHRWRRGNKIRIVNQKGSSFPGGLVRYKGPTLESDLLFQSGDIIELDTKKAVPTKELSFREIFKLFLGLDQLRHTALYKATMIEFLGMTIFTYMSIGIVVATINFYNFSVPYHDQPHNPGLVAHPAQIIIIAIAHILLLLIVLISISPGSGGILNCTITLATIFTGYTTLTKGVFYIIAELLGSIVGTAMMYASLPYEIYSRTNLGQCNYGDSLSAGNALATEYMISLFNLLVIFGTALDPRQTQQFGNLLPLLLACITLGLSLYVPPGLGFLAAPVLTQNRKKLRKTISDQSIDLYIKSKVFKFKCQHKTNTLNDLFDQQMLTKSNASPKRKSEQALQQRQLESNNTSTTFKR
ncbi:hypothetical protein PPL_05743 [Heterostelium album PN500]|uniref:Uncharacterized protein n=1 Tax=Heterostelium pallidum (strain ATCC 26659 / Pp 5 / PN500) TaxID=670386 RepID=D3BB12_HETP5|nr:hypothetical protein PPL_05743 [Heterostelium album PN500]EFA81749.1 hypothetical protein PPL_05743 [Heterostelium album PN500]|eukprot:XP_020433866.1 hypothetical protein PPL_05743 [Heterostelium album PN500]